MDSPSNQLPPETDLCKIPTGIPPPGQSSDLDNADLKSLTISLGVILTTIAVVFSLGRLYVNFRKLTAGDCELSRYLAYHLHETVLMNIDQSSYLLPLYPILPQ